MQEQEKNGGERMSLGDSMANKMAEKFEIAKAVGEIQKIVEVLNKIVVELKRLEANNDEQIIPALSTIYEALQVMAEKQHVVLPTPKCDMTVEEASEPEMPSISPMP